MDINQEILITLVHGKPALWDKSTESYKDKKLKYDDWKDVCKQLKPNFEDLNGKEKKEFGKLIMKKWTNMKDNWIKFNRKLNERKSGSGGKKLTKYMFYEQMLFLKKNFEHGDTGSSINQVDSHNNTSQIETNFDNKPKKRHTKSPKLKKRKKVELSEVDSKLMKFMDSRERHEHSRSMNFFRGIASTVDKFNEQNIIEFQFQVISVIKNIQQKEQSQNMFSYSQWNQDHCRRCQPASSALSNIQRATYGYRSAEQPRYPQTFTYDDEVPSGSSFRHQPNSPDSQLSINSDATSTASFESLSIGDEFDFNSES